MQAEGNDFDCRQASRLLSAACERALTPAESQALRYHLDRCLLCRNFGDQLDFLHRASQRLRSGGK
ncbi:MAG TPA: zf-HC2 domain-containing protein [Usitatibacter sp.]|nr:zf-HC2 domain-containing protein [Usitatibacter sp.]